MKRQKSIEKIDELFLTINEGKIYSRVINDTEKILIEKALKRSFGNQSIAAKLLGMNRNTLHSKIKKLNIDVKKYRI